MNRMLKSSGDKLRVAVTGSSGWIGSYVVPLLKDRGCTVLEIADANAAESIRNGGSCDVFINLAWLGSRGPQRADYVLQLEMVKTALDYYQLAVRLGCRRFICPGTIGELMVDLPECHSIRSQNFVYVNVKHFLHRLLMTVEKPDQCRVVWTRLGNLYGKGDTGNLLNWTLARVLAGEEASFGPARQPYEFMAIEDCARALVELAVASSLSEGCYYIGVGEPRELAELLREVGRIAGREDLIAIGKRPDDGTRYMPEWFDVAPLHRDTGFVPKISFEDGVMAVIDFMKHGVAHG